MKKCCECGVTGDIQDHHVIPRSEGGTFTVPLCTSCHAKVHSRDSMASGTMIRKGLAKKIANGYKAGSPRYGYKFNATRTEEVEIPKEFEILQKVLCWIEDDSLGYGVYTRLSKYLNDIGAPRRVGGQWTQGAGHITFRRYVVDEREKRKKKLIKEVDELLEDK